MFNLGTMLKKGDIAVISFRYVTLTDGDGLITLLGQIKELERKGIKFVFSGIGPAVAHKVMSIKSMNLKTEFRSRGWRSLVEY